MTLDDLSSGDQSDTPRRPADPSRPFVDREVSIDAVRDMDPWTRLEAAIVRRRGLRAPEGLEARIMAAILVELPG